MLDGVGPTCTSTGRASGSLSRRGSRRSRSRLSGLTRLAEASRESEVRPTTVSNVIVSSRLIPGSPTVPCASLPVMVSWIGTVTRYEDDTCAEANDEAPSTMTLAMKIDRMKPPRTRRAVLIRETANLELEARRLPNGQYAQDSAGQTAVRNKRDVAYPD